jgi:hypothetical protein
MPEKLNGVFHPMPAQKIAHVVVLPHRFEEG